MLRYISEGNIVILLQFIYAKVNAYYFVFHLLKLVYFIFSKDNNQIKYNGLESLDRYHSET